MRGTYVKVISDKIDFSMFYADGLDFKIEIERCD